MPFPSAVGFPTLTTTSCWTSYLFSRTWPAPKSRMSVWFLMLLSESDTSPSFGSSQPSGLHAARRRPAEAVSIMALASSILHLPVVVLRLLSVSYRQFAIVWGFFVSPDLIPHIDCMERSARDRARPAVGVWQPVQCQWKDRSGTRKVRERRIRFIMAPPGIGSMDLFLSIPLDM